jgi:hypothetical protein
MLLGRAMLPHRSSPRSATRGPATGTRVVAAGCAALLTASLSACSSAQKMTTGLKVRNSVEKLGDQTAASVVASVDGTTDHTYAFLRHAGADVTRADATRVARAELTMAVASGSDTSALKDVPKSEGLNLAGSLNFGGTDVVAVKSVDDACYLRLRLDRLVGQAGGSRAQQRTADRVMALADRLPTTLGAAKDALKGRWVRADPHAFGDFARAAETLSARTAQDESNERKAEESARDAKGAHDAQSAEDAGDAKGERGGDEASTARGGKGEQNGKGGKARRAALGGLSRQAREDAARAARALRDTESRRAGVHSRSRQFRKAAAIGSALDGQSQRAFIAGVERLLVAHAKFTPVASGGGRGDGVQRLRVTLPGRQAAGDLSTATAALGVHLPPQRVPDGAITGELLLRRGQLASLTVDLGQFTDGGDGGRSEGGKSDGGRSGEERSEGGDGAAARHLPLRLEFNSGEAVPAEAPGGTRKLHPQDLLAAALYGALGTRNF